MRTRSLLFVSAGISAFFLTVSPTNGRAAATQVGPAYFGPGTTLVNFDTTPFGQPIASGTVLGGIYADWGVTFGPEDGVTDWAGIPTSLPNRAWCSPDGLQPIDCHFFPPVHAVGAYGFDYRLEVFDAAGNLIHSAEHTEGSPGLFGGDSGELGFLGIASDVPIVTARFSRYWLNQSSFGFEIDDLQYWPALATRSQQESMGGVKVRYR